MHSARGIKVRLSRHDHIAPSGQGPEFWGKGIPGFAPHDDRAAQGNAFEVSQVLCQVPGQCVVLTNHAIGSASKNQMQLHDKLNGHWRFNCRVGFVAANLKVFHGVVKNRSGAAQHMQ